MNEGFELIGIHHVQLAIPEGEDADAVRGCLDDPEPAVAAAAETALRELSRRLDRPL